MASYFVACEAQPDGAHAVHDRSRCPPACFPYDAEKEYLGEFDEAGQALAVARLRYAHARGCACCDGLIPVTRVVAGEPLPDLFPLRT